MKIDNYSSQTIYFPINYSFSTTPINAQQSTITSSLTSSPIDEKHIVEFHLEYNRHPYNGLKYFLSHQLKSENYRNTVRNRFLENDPNQHQFCKLLLKYILEKNLKSSIRGLRMLDLSSDIVAANAMGDLLDIEDILEKCSFEKKDLLRSLMVYHSVSTNNFGRAKELLNTIENTDLKAQVERFYLKKDPEAQPSWKKVLKTIAYIICLSRK